MKWIAAALAVGALALTGCGGRSPAERHERVQRFINHRMSNILDDIDATDAQRQKVNAAKDQVMADMHQLVTEHQNMKQTLLAEWQSATPDAAKTHALVDQRIDALRAAAHRATDAAIAVHATLTPEQREKLSKKLSRRWH